MALAKDKYINGQLVVLVVEQNHLCSRRLRDSSTRATIDYRVTAHESS